MQRSDWLGHVTVPKGGQSRQLPMTQRLTAALKAARHLRSERVLCLPDGSPITRDRVIKAMLADLESRRCSPQDLRKNAKALIAIYRTSRSTYARARAEALETFSKFS